MHLILATDVVKDALIKYFYIRDHMSVCEVKNKIYQPTLQLT